MLFLSILFLIMWITIAIFTIWVNFSSVLIWSLFLGTWLILMFTSFLSKKMQTKNNKLIGQQLKKRVKNLSGKCNCIFKLMKLIGIGVYEDKILKKLHLQPIKKNRELANIFIDKLIQYEEFTNLPPSLSSVTNFAEIKNAPIKAFNSYADLVNQINQNLGTKDFSFNNIAQNFKYNMQDFHNQIVEFYNFLANSKIIPQEALTTLIFNINQKRPPILTFQWGIRGLTVINIQEKSHTVRMGIYLHKKWNDTKMLALNYKIGQLITNHPFQILIHEFGHAIQFFYVLPQILQKNLNKGNHPINFTNNVYSESLQIGPKDQKNAQKIWQWLEDFLIFAQTKLGEKIDHEWNKKGHKIEKRDLELIKLVTVSSKYGRLGYLTTKKFNDNSAVGIADLEWFAEGFAYYFCATPEQRNKIWEFWHDFLTKDLPLFVNTNSFNN